MPIPSHFRFPTLPEELKDVVVDFCNPCMSGFMTHANHELQNLILKNGGFCKNITEIELIFENSIVQNEWCPKMRTYLPYLRVRAHFECPNCDGTFTASITENLFTPEPFHRNNWISVPTKKPFLVFFKATSFLQNRANHAKRNAAMYTQNKMSHDKQVSKESGDDGEVFEVEALLATRVQRKKRVYLVRWKGRVAWADAFRRMTAKMMRMKIILTARSHLAPLGAIGQSWLMENSDDDDEKKESKNEPENGAGKYSIRRSTRRKSISVEKEEKRREAERKAEKERKKLEKQKREEEKRKNAECEESFASISGPKRSIKVAKVDNKADEGELLPLVLKIRRAVYREGKYFVNVVVDSEEKEIPLDEVWKLNPHGLMQHLIS
ncbi:unnamed protein product, partial [Mesorhabditis belari]|uniref:Chromo domain-containing protein n=1 Tax=Mesorhabditis belari TaxID=2138241 RepID=A0AAF3FJ11_9BILA